MTEREHILEEIAEAMLRAKWELPREDKYLDFRVLAPILADAALRVIERKSDSRQETYSRICNCGESGYGENSPYSNHPHRKGCPQYTGKYDRPFPTNATKAVRIKK